MTDGAGPAKSAAGPEIAGYVDLVRIGRGGFATVYRAHEVAFNRDVALKVLDASDVSPEATSRFERECKAIGALSGHAHIVTVYGAGQTADGRPFISMDLMESGSLADRLKREGRISPPESVRIGFELLDALGAAHDIGVLHRDIKPDNILVSRFGSFQIGDFGISTIPGGYETTTGNISATLGFAAPEIIDGARATVASDLYSLAATLATLIIGQPPFVRHSGEVVAAWLKRLVVEPPPDLVTFGASPALSAVIRTAMSKDPATRFASASAFRNALSSVPEAGGTSPAVRQGPPAVQTSVLAGPSVPSAVPPSPVAPPWPAASAPTPYLTADRSGSNRGIYIAGGVVAAVIAAVVAVVATRGSNPTSSPPGPAAAATIPSVSTPAPAGTPAVEPVGTPASTGASKDLTWVTYTNPRFGFSVDRPASFTPDPAPADGDGQSWTAEDGQVSFAVYGQNNSALGLSPDQVKVNEEQGLVVTLQRVLFSNQVTVSGYRAGDTIVYFRSYVGHGNIDTLEWSYPTSERRQWNAPLLHTVDTFEVGPLATGR